MIGAVCARESDRVQAQLVMEFEMEWLEYQDTTLNYQGLFAYVEESLVLAEEGGGTHSLLTCLPHAPLFLRGSHTRFSASTHSYPVPLSV